MRMRLPLGTSIVKGACWSRRRSRGEADDALAIFVEDGGRFAADFLGEELFEPGRIDGAGDADERLAGGAALVLAGVDGDEEFFLGEDGFAGEFDAAAADHDSCAGI